MGRYAMIKGAHWLQDLQHQARWPCFETLVRFLRVNQSSEADGPNGCERTTVKGVIMPKILIGKYGVRKGLQSRGQTNGMTDTVFVHILYKSQSKEEQYPIWICRKNKL